MPSGENLIAVGMKGNSLISNIWFFSVSHINKVLSSDTLNMIGWLGHKAILIFLFEKALGFWELMICEQWDLKNKE